MLLCIEAWSGGDVGVGNDNPREVFGKELSVESKVSLFSNMLPVLIYSRC